MLCSAARKSALLLVPFAVVLACLPFSGLARLGTQRDVCMLDYSKIPFTTLSGPLSATYGDVRGSIGSGASSSVHLIRRFSDNATLALKQFAPVPQNASFETRETLWQYIALEYHIGTLLNGVEGFARTEELLHSTYDSTWSIVQSYCPRSLDSEIQANTLDETSLLNLSRQ